MTNDYISGVGNSLLDGENLISSVGNGMKQSVIQGFSGVFIGGIASCLTATIRGNNLWTGSPRTKGAMNLTSERIDFNLPEQRDAVGYGNELMQNIDSNGHVLRNNPEPYPYFSYNHFRISFPPISIKVNENLYFHFRIQWYILDPLL